MTLPNPASPRSLATTRPNTVRLLTTVLVAGCVSFATPGDAYACDDGEATRITMEMTRLAKRDAWKGVESNFERLLATKCPLNYERAMMGAQAADSLGKTQQRYDRLKLALDTEGSEGSEDNTDIAQELEAIEAAYKQVQIIGHPRIRPVLERPVAPFAPDQRRSVSWAQLVVSETGSFEGLLPHGDYKVGEKTFSVTAEQAESLVIEAGKGERTTPDKAIRYVGLVATIGPGTIQFPTGAQDNIATSDFGDFGERYQWVPTQLGGLGLSAMVGAEVGISYREPAMGLSMMMGFGSAFGDRAINQATLWPAFVLRPGQLRVAAGPQLGIVGRGTGQSGHLGVDPQVIKPNPAPSDPAWANPSPGEANRLETSGFSGSVGLQADVSYGIVDLGKYRGAIGLGGNWHSDASKRTIIAAALRFGIIPEVPRFNK